jgi:hypothetical protein
MGRFCPPGTREPARAVPTRDPGGPRDYLRSPMAASRARSGRTALLLSITLGLLALAAWWVTRSEAPPAAVDGATAVARPGSPSVLEGGGAAPVEIRPLQALETEARAGDLRDGPTTVLFPLQVDLELVRSSLLPDVPSGPPLGSGRTARLSGRIADANGQGATARIEFLGGPNAGRVLETGADGAFGAIDLYPGLEVVAISGPRILGSRREVRLREGQTAELNLGYGSPGAVSGRVVDETNEPVEGATVRIDGQAGLTDRTGHFFVGAVAGGQSVLVEIDHPDFAPFRSDLGVALSVVAQNRQPLYVLRRPAALELVLTDDVGGPDPAQVWIVPQHGGLGREFPWHQINPVTVGTAPVRLDRLPAGPVELRIYRSGAVGHPPRRAVTLVAGGTQAVELGLEPAPSLSGRVVDEGQVVTGARVRLVAADPVTATLRHFGADRAFLEQETLPQVPAVRQETLSDAAGQFRFTAFEELSEWRLLEAVGPDGRSRAVRAVGPNEREVELELEPVESGTAALQLRLPRRFQALAVTLTVNGRPSAEFELPPREDLEVDSLARGQWRLRVRWRGQVLLDEPDLELEDLTTRTVELPEAALIGQDRDTWVRAGRAWPLD